MEQSQTAAPEGHAYTAPIIEHRVQFTGSGSEYFRIWIVNLALTIATLGIYSAWAKVRRLQYFHRNTLLAGGSFDYHADPVALLKGRILGGVLFGVFAYAGYLSPWIGLIAALAIAAAMPRLLRQGLRFRAHYTSYRGLRFHFLGTVAEAYRVFGAPFILLALAIASGAEEWQENLKFASAILFLGYMAFVPYFHAKAKGYQHGNLAYGTARFTFSARAADFMKIYVRAWGLSVLGVALAFGLMIAMVAMLKVSPHLNDEENGAQHWAVIAVFALALYASWGAVWPYFVARLQNLAWNKTAIEGMPFHSALKARSLLKVWAVNALLLTLTLGLYWPFAVVRAYRLRAECVTLEGPGELDIFVAGSTQAMQSATGQEAADLFDVDVAM